MDLKWKGCIVMMMVFVLVGAKICFFLLNNLGGSTHELSLVFRIRGVPSIKPKIDMEER
jgi:hypothetical protein